MKSNIALIGFMGTGKSEVGRLLAARLKFKFIETDALVEARAGKSISRIFDEVGEIGFRELEIEVVKDVARERRAVIACGGGLVLNKINIDRLKERSVIVLLTATPSVILKRVAAQAGQRPLLDVDNPAMVIRDMLKSRKPFYTAAADTVVDTARLTPHQIIEEIINRLESDESLHFQK